MGREIKRVPLDFNWPFNKVWGGYVNPFYSQATECPYCDGSGLSPEAICLKNLWYGYKPFKPEDRGSIPFTITDIPVRKFAERQIANFPEYYGTGDGAIIREAQRLCNFFNRSWSHHLNQDDVNTLVESERLMDFTHTWTGKKWEKKNPSYIPTAKEVNDWSITGFGHDSINQWIVCKSECKRLGYETHCNHCKGEGELWPSENIKKQYEEWNKVEPLTGDGYQLWETVSEGSPISPVFSTPEELADWLAIDENQKGTDKGTTRDQWLKFIQGPAWASSLISIDGNVMTGVQGITQ